MAGERGEKRLSWTPFPKLNVLCWPGINLCQLCESTSWWRWRPYSAERLKRESRSRKRSKLKRNTSAANAKGQHREPKQTAEINPVNNHDPINQSPGWLCSQWQRESKAERNSELQTWPRAWNTIQHKLFSIWRDVRLVCLTEPWQATLEAVNSHHIRLDLVIPPLHVQTQKKN